MKILVLVMSHHTNDEIFLNYKKIWENQISKLDSNKFVIDFKFLYSNERINQEYIVEDNNLISKCPENYWFSLLIKVLNGFDFFIKNDFDLVFKTNLSTFINFKKFFEYCENLDNSRKYIYDGAVGQYQDYSFCSGAGMLLNRESVNIVLNNKSLINESWTDDIFIGYILNKLNEITPNYGNMNRFDIVSENSHFTKEDIINNTHIRVKVRINNLDINYSNTVYEFLQE